MAIDFNKIWKKVTFIFTFLKETKVYAELRARALELLVREKDNLKAYIEEYLKEKSPLVKERVIDYIMDHIQLKFPYKFFKGQIRKALEKNFDKLIEFLLAKLQEI